MSQNRSRSFVDNESPPVDRIAKKIDFKDSLITTSEKDLNLRTSPKLSKQRNDSKLTLGGTN